MNALFIEQIQSFPDTTITLTSSKKIIVRESEIEVARKIREFYQSIGLIGTKEKQEKMNAKVIIIILSAVIILGAGGYAAWSFFTSPTSEAKEPSASELAANSVTTDEITTDLEDGSIVRIQFQLITDGEKAKEEVTARQFQLKNIVIKEMTAMNKEDFQAGLTDLEKNLKKKLNEEMQEGSIEDVYTVSKVLQ